MELHMEDREQTHTVQKTAIFSVILGYILPQQGHKGYLL